MNARNHRKQRGQPAVVQKKSSRTLNGRIRREENQRQRYTENTKETKNNSENYGTKFKTKGTEGKSVRSNKKTEHRRKARNHLECSRAVTVLKAERDNIRIRLNIL